MLRTAILMVFAAVAFTETANARLQRYPDEALLREMTYRGYTCTYEDQRRQNEYIVSASCDPYSNLIFNIYDNEGNKSASMTYYMGSESKCNTERTRVLALTSSGRLDKAKTIALCDPYSNMIKIRFAKDSLTEVEQVYQGNERRCSSEADAFNSLFN